MQSYSQCGEDAYLYQHVFGNKRNGVFIEMGALDGVRYSNTKFFEDNFDWTGILIEPHPDKFKELQKNRPKCLLYNSLVSDISEQITYKYFVDDYAAVSGVKHTLPDSHYDEFFDKFPELEQSEIQMKPVSLTSIVQQSRIEHFDLLSLDVEGHEFEVLKSWDFSVPIDYILIEMRDKDKYRNSLAKSMLKQHKYKFITQVADNELWSKI